MPLVMCKRSWPGVFRRCIRDARGEVQRVLAFAPGEPVEVAEVDLHQIENALGNPLIFVRLDESRRPREVATADAAIASPCLEPPGPDAGEEEKSLDELTVEQLLRIAGEEQVDLGGAKKKADIIAALTAAGIE